MPYITSGLRLGSVSLAPLLPAVAPIGFVSGLAAREGGMSLLEAAGLSVFIFAGAAQLATIELLGDDAPLAIIALTVVAINLRMLMYSASISPFLADVRLPMRLWLAYLLTDHSFAVSYNYYVRTAKHPASARVSFLAGCGLTLWAGWQAFNLLGYLTASGLPESFPVAFAVPLTFLTLLVPAIRSVPHLVAAVTAASVALAIQSFPSNLSVPIGAAAGIALGVAVSRSTRSVQR